MTAADSRPIAVVGPSSKRSSGGIAVFTTQLAEALSRSAETVHWQWSRPYPGRPKTNGAPEAGGRPALDILSPRSWKTVAEAIASGTPRAVLINWVHPVQALPIRTLVQTLRERPVWCICHNVRPHEPFPAWRALSRYALAGAAGVIVHSTVTRSEAERVFPGKPVTELFLPPLLSGDPPAPHDGARVRNKLICFGHVRRYKGIETLLDAFAFFRKTAPDAELIVAGSPLSSSIIPGSAERYAASLTARATSLGLGDSVRFCFRYLPDGELRELLGSAHAAIFPFRTVTSSASIVSALALDVPVVASRLPGLSDAVVEGKNGALAEAGDARSLAAALERISSMRFDPGSVRDTVGDVTWAEYTKRLLAAVGAS